MHKKCIVLLLTVMPMLLSGCSEKLTDTPDKVIISTEVHDNIPDPDKAMLLTLPTGESVTVGISDGWIIDEVGIGNDFGFKIHKNSARVKMSYVPDDDYIEVQNKLLDTYLEAHSLDESNDVLDKVFPSTHTEHESYTSYVNPIDLCVFLGAGHTVESTTYTAVYKTQSGYLVLDAQYDDYDSLDEFAVLEEAFPISDVLSEEDPVEAFSDKWNTLNNDEKKLLYDAISLCNRRWSSIKADAEYISNNVYLCNKSEDFNMVDISKYIKNDITYSARKSLDKYIVIDETGEHEVTEDDYYKFLERHNLTETETVEDESSETFNTSVDSSYTGIENFTTN